MQTHHQEQITPSRSDHSTVLKVEHQAAREAADYDRWFDAKVQASMDGVKDGSNRVYSRRRSGQFAAEIIARFSGRKTV
ncbi:MAG: hypothetical protein IPH54_17595 [Rhodoferax sp.]|nr:hypothetical protein [Rhodoferax sp.]